MIPSPPQRSGRAPGAPRLVARGAAENPDNRFERIARAPLADDAALDDEPGPALGTRFYRDATRSVLSHNESPDVGFDTGLNPYRGCEHGCIYCYARPTHEYLGFSAGLDFESRILVKQDAPALLRATLASPGWRPRPIAVGAATDPYQPIESTLRVTRRCLEVCAEYRNPVVVITKSALVLRDVDLLAELARVDAAAVQISVTTLDDDLRRRMEPRASAPRSRLETLRALSNAGIPAGLMLAPLIPGLNDREIPAIVAAAAKAGARTAHYIALRLPHAVAGLFESWLARHFPERAKHVLDLVRQMRGGALNDPRFHSRMRGSGAYAEQLNALFALACRRAGLRDARIPLSCGAFRRPGPAQLALL